MGSFVKASKHAAKLRADRERDGYNPRCLGGNGETPLFKE
jgi:hypothetical protein